MKRLLIILLCAALALPLAGCFDSSYSKEEQRELVQSAYEDGYSDGYEDGSFDYEDDGYDDGYDDGHYDGYLAGYDEGYIAGYKQGYDEGSEYNEDLPEYDGAGLVWQYTPNSSLFYAIAYDEGNHVLAVMFNSNKTRTYLYYGFSETTWDAFTSAESMGNYYNENIKGQYHGARIEEIKGTYFEP